MRVLTEDAVVPCPHGPGLVDIVPTQNLVTIAGRRILVETNPEGRPIKGCPLPGPPAPSKPCQLSLRVEQGYSTFVRIEGRRICLDTVTGLTDGGAPPGTSRYFVRDPGQALVTGAA